MAAGLAIEEQRRAAAVIEAAERTTSLGEFMAVTLAAIDEHVGVAGSAFMLTLAEPPLPGSRAYAGDKQGRPYVLEEYFERWADCDPLGSDAARADFRRRGYATISEVYPKLDSGRRRFVDDFLRRTRERGQLSVRLAAGWTDGFLTLMGPEQPGEYELALVGAIVPRLTELLRERLPAGLDCGLSVREAQVAELVALGFSNREAAGVLGVEEDTVKKHVSHAMAKAGVGRRSELAVGWATGGRLSLATSQGADAGKPGPA